MNLTTIPLSELQKLSKIELSYVVDAYQRMENKADFFLKNNFFDKLSGQRRIREMILAGHSAAEIEATWKEDVIRFKAQRKKYLIYPE